MLNQQELSVSRKRADEIIDSDIDFKVEEVERIQEETSLPILPSSTEIIRNIISSDENTEDSNVENENKNKAFNTTVNNATSAALKEWIAAILIVSVLVLLLIFSFVVYKGNSAYFTESHIIQLQELLEDASIVQYAKQLKTPQQQKML